MYMESGKIMVSIFVLFSLCTFFLGGRAANENDIDDDDENEQQFYCRFMNGAMERQETQPGGALNFHIRKRSTIAFKLDRINSRDCT